MRSALVGDWYGTGLLIEYQVDGVKAVVLYFVPVFLC